MLTIIIYVKRQFRHALQNMQFLQLLENCFFNNSAFYLYYCIVAIRLDILFLVTSD